LEKASPIFSWKRGLAATTTLIAGAISTNAVQAAPALLTKSITATVLATGAASGSTLTLGAFENYGVDESKNSDYQRYCDCRRRRRR